MFYRGFGCARSDYVSFVLCDALSTWQIFISIKWRRESPSRFRDECLNVMSNFKVMSRPGGRPAAGPDRTDRTGPGQDRSGTGSGPDRTGQDRSGQDRTGSGQDRSGTGTGQGTGQAQGRRQLRARHWHGMPWQGRTGLDHGMDWTRRMTWNRTRHKGLGAPETSEALGPVTNTAKAF